MEDAFSLLGEPRRPWLDADALKQTFLSLSSTVHPDRVHASDPAAKAAATAQYSALNAAYNSLREPKDRLLLLLELETGVPPSDIQRIPPGTMDLFVDVGQTCRDADAFLQEKESATSPMVKVRLFEKGMEWTDRLNGLQQRINAKRDALHAELRDMNTAWEQAPKPGEPGRAAALPLERLEQIYRVLSYVARWTGQIQERVVQLAV
jgi:curved DNA-binding protein CbpA